MKKKKSIQKTDSTEFAKQCKIRNFHKYQFQQIIVSKNQTILKNIVLTLFNSEWPKLNGT